MEIINNQKNKKIALEGKIGQFEEENADEEDMDDEEIEEVDSDEWDEEEGDPISRTDCFFCMHHSSTLEKNAIHMSTNHSFFIPDVDFLVDLPGLFEYLGAKVNYYYQNIIILSGNFCFAKTTLAKLYSECFSCTNRLGKDTCAYGVTKKHEIFEAAQLFKST